MGARNKDEHFLKHSIKGQSYCILTTDDGSLGIKGNVLNGIDVIENICLLYTSPSPRDRG